MKGTIASLAGTLVVGAALALPAVSFAQALGQLARQRAGNFPEMHAARHKLNEAKEILVHQAAGDFHSHKASAIAHIDQAIQEINSGIKEEGGTP
ncbi:MAG: hypothetical protein WA867_05095 [Candidatus Acidiferrales bacterium]